MFGPSAARLRRVALVLGLLGALVAVMAPAASAAGPKQPTNLKVMSRNIYLGTGLTNVVSAPDFPSFIAAVTQDVQNVIATDFPTRAGALAAEIAATKPDLVGLQEVSLWRTQNPSDLTGPNATDPFLDFLTILQANLAAAGQSYVVKSTSDNADVEAPFFNGSNLQDIRLTDRDVILAKADIASFVSNPQDGLYAVQLIVPSIAGPVSFTRGWTSADVSTKKGTVRFFNTHLETEVAPPVQEAQGAEFLGLVDASPHPVIAVGDFNSASDGSTTDTYDDLLAGGLSDAWTTANGSAPGLTCCQNELLTNSTSENATRIDLVLTKGSFSVGETTVVGGTPFRASPAPLWASDHAGVSSVISIAGP